MKKVLITVVGGFLVLIGAIFIIIPGPSVIFLLPGLYLLSLEYDQAKIWLRRVQKMMRNSARWLDKKLAARKAF
jgi:uncharacterized membrane protein YbaN (DUF454 family)